MHVRAVPGFLRSLAIYANPAVYRRWRRFYATILRPGDLAFDIGAHVGTRARAMRAAGARVVAVEPQRPFSTFLRHTLPSSIEVVEAGISSNNGEATLAISSRHPTVSTLSRTFVDEGRVAHGFQHVRWDGAQTVPLLTLDAMIARFGAPEHIKIDVEGAEMEVLKGLTVPVNLLSVEYLPAMPHLALELVDELRRRGNTEFNLVSGETAAFLWDEWRDAIAVKAWLRELTPDARSGDLFARRKTG